MFHVKQRQLYKHYNSLIMNNKTLIDNLRCIPDFPKKGINFRDVTTLYKNAECLQIMLDELEAIYKDKGITKIVGIESRGFVMETNRVLCFFSELEQHQRCQLYFCK